MAAAAEEAAAAKAMEAEEIARLEERSVGHCFVENAAPGMSSHN